MQPFLLSVMPCVGFTILNLPPNEQSLQPGNCSGPGGKLKLFALAHYAIQHNDLIFAGLLLLGFFAMLRTGELLQVTADDLILTGSKGLVGLYNTKTGKRHAAAEVVAFDDPFTLDTLLELVALKKQQGLRHTPLWILSAAAFRYRFAHYVKRFDLTTHCFRPYSLRRGGATALFQSCGSMETVLLKGRWNSPQVGKIYIQDGLSFLPGLTFTPKAAAMLKQWYPYST